MICARPMTKTTAMAKVTPTPFWEVVASRKDAQGCSFDSDSFDEMTPNFMMKKQSPSSSPQDSPLIVYSIPRSREVGQSYFSSVFTTFYAQIHAMILLLFWIRPHLILTNGPGTCLPICLAGLLLRILGICPTQIVFCESYCRVETLSLTGILLYPIVDVFIVHWKELLQEYPLAQCVNSFVHS